MKGKERDVDHSENWKTTSRREEEEGDYRREGVRPGTRNHLHPCTEFVNRTNQNIS